MKKQHLNIPKKTGFQVPEGYFDALENSLSQHVQLEKPMPEKHGFQVPDNYFTALETRVTENTKTQKRPKVTALHPKTILRYSAGIAAMFVLAFLLFNTNTKTEPITTSYALENYIEENIAISEYDLKELLTDETLTLNLQLEEINPEELAEFVSSSVDESNLFSEEEK